MELEKTDEEQVEALQVWWRENWLSLVSGLVLGLGAIVGWQYYGEHRSSAAADASQTYETVKTQLAIGDAKAAQVTIARLESDHSGSPYVAQAHLAVAQAHADKSEWSEAEAEFRKVLDSSDKALVGLAQLRLARALWAQGKVDDALAVLAQANQPAYAPLYAELKGDIAVAQSNVELAKASYAQALAEPRDYVDRNAVQRKLDALN